MAKIDNDKMWASIISCLEEQGNYIQLWAIRSALKDQGLQYKSETRQIEEIDAPKFKIEAGKADKVEPKFHEGEWITNGDYTWQIVSVTDLDYTLQSQDGNIVGDTISHVDEYFHSFSIQDAKDGDVVVDKSDGTIGIFQSIGHHPDGGSYNDPSYCFLHCRYDDFFYADFENGNTMDSDDVIPATKEQRDTLMKAMADAGYTFDFEKKELKKIEQPKQEWSEEDEIWFKELELMALSFSNDDSYRKKFFDWLKSLRPQNRWKPSDEQIKALESATENCAYSEYQDCLRELIGQLKKLKD